MPSRSPVRPSAALRQALRAWTLLHADSAQAVGLAQQVLSRVRPDPAARAWAQLVLGYHHLYLSTPDEALAALERARQACADGAQRAGVILAQAGIARAWWRQGRVEQAHEQLLALRDEGLQVLRHDQRSVLLNFISGSHSSVGQSDQVFAYLHSALRESRLSRQAGFEAVQHCNLAHELLQFGDFEAALLQTDDGLERCRPLANPRLLSALLINRVIALSELGRASQALPDLHQVCAIPTNAAGRGHNATHFETLALVALRAGDLALGRELVATALGRARDLQPDERNELAQAQALLARADGDPGRALSLMLPQAPALLVDGVPGQGLTPRVRGSGLQLLADLQEGAGLVADALATLRQWQRWQAQRAALASRARYQAVALETELMRLRRQLDEQEQRRRQTERAQVDLQRINQELSRKVREVEQLQEALREQATRDALTGLFNRRHLNDTLPTLFALALREDRPLSVALIDLDHFKAVNDQHGHDVGDQVLAAFGTLLLSESRHSDVVCRYGGEEFCLLMPHTPAAAAGHKLRGLLQRWPQQAVAPDGQVLGGLSFTAGVCDTTAGKTSCQQLLKAADEALLAGKRGGRAQVRLASFPHAADAA